LGLLPLSNLATDRGNPPTTDQLAQASVGVDDSTAVIENQKSYEALKSTYLK